jgi:MFS family permease
MLERIMALPSTSFTIIAILLLISDVISKMTKRKLSTMLVSSLIFMAIFIPGYLPGTVGTMSGLSTLGGAILGLTLVNVGTVISVDEFKKQWKTVCIGVFAIVGIGIIFFTIGEMFMHRNFVVGGAAIASGGTVAWILVQEALLNMNEIQPSPELVLAASFPFLIANFQMFVGVPIASGILTVEAKRVRDEFRNGNIKVVEQTEEEKAAEAEKVRLADEGTMPDVFRTVAGSLSLAGFFVVLSSIMQFAIYDLTGFVAHRYIFALLFGIGLRATNFAPKGFLFKIDSYGIIGLSLFTLGIPALAMIDLDGFMTLLPMIVFSLFLGVVGNITFAFIMSKLLKVSPAIGIAIGLTSFFGYPTTMIISNEISEEIGETPEEIAAISQEILPKMVVAGFATVTISSVIFTGFLLQFLVFV